MGGYANAEKTRPWEKDTIVHVFSTTKIMAALCIHVLADRGQLDFDAPVANYWPEFAQAGKDKLPVKYLLSHSSGLSGWDEKIEMNDYYNWEKVTSLLASQKPWWEPGTKSGYHAMTFGYLLGEIVKRITGKTLGKFFKEEIASPLDADFHIGFGKELDFRVADLIPPPPPNLFQRIFLRIIFPFIKKSIFMKTFSSMLVMDFPQLNLRD